jgi:hypothetical protein
MLFGKRITLNPRDNSARAFIVWHCQSISSLVLSWKPTGEILPINITTDADGKSSYYTLTKL